jgi:DNA mismatch endonuclease, patch repair protein
MDTLTPLQRSERMGRIRSKDTKPELQVRRLLHGMGYRYRLHRRDLPGAPDLVFGARRKVIFVHGCFWHAHQSCSIANRPKSRQEFWDDKFARNRERDATHVEALKARGWDVRTVWECELKDRDKLTSRLLSFLGPMRICDNGDGTAHPKTH